MAGASELRVAAILSEYQVVLNGGRNAGVQTGYRYTIYELGQEIKDPISKQSLGSLEIVKGEVTVLNVQDQMCIAYSDDPEKIRRYLNVPSVRSTADITGTAPKSIASLKVGDAAKRTG